MYWWPTVLCTSKWILCSGISCCWILQSWWWWWLEQVTLEKPFIRRGGWRVFAGRLHCREIFDKKLRKKKSIEWKVQSALPAIRLYVQSGSIDNISAFAVPKEKFSCKYATSIWKCPSPFYQVQICKLEISLSTSSHASKCCRWITANSVYSIDPWWS